MGMPGPGCITDTIRRLHRGWFIMKQCTFITGRFSITNTAVTLMGERVIMAAAHIRHTIMAGVITDSDTIRHIDSRRGLQYTVRRGIMNDMSQSPARRSPTEKMTAVIGAKTAASTDARFLLTDLPRSVFTYQETPHGRGRRSIKPIERQPECGDEWFLFSLARPTC
ncbi:MAG: hypothetical protein ACOYUZ_01560 [Patescibacteria group bacterium]